MVETVKIVAKARQRAGKGAARATRRAGRVPAVIYGGKQPPALIDLDPKAVIAEIGRPGFYTRLFDVEIDGKSERTLPRDVQLHPVYDTPEHVDFMRVSEGTRIRVSVPVKFLDQEKSPGLKRGGVLNVVRHRIDVYCRIDNMPQQIDVTLDGLDIGDSIHIQAVKLPAGVTPTIARNFTIAAVAAPSVLKTAEEEAAEAAAAAAEAATLEGTVPAEGAAPAPGAPGAPGAPAAAGGAAPAAAAAGAEKKPAATAATPADKKGDKKGEKKGGKK